MVSLSICLKTRDSYLYIPDQVLRERSKQKHLIQQAEKDLVDLIENDPDFKKEAKGFVTYKGVLYLKMWTKEQTICVSCSKLSSGYWTLDNVNDTLILLEGLKKFADTTENIEFKTVRVSMA